MTIEALRAVILQIDPRVLLIVPFVLILLVLWELVWKVTACWKAARNNQFEWFLFILIINSVGILPIIYIYFFQKNKKKKSKRKSRRK